MPQLRLVNLLKEEEPKQKGSSQFPGKYHLGGGYYSSKEGGDAEFKSEDGKLKPLTQDEKAVHKAKTSGEKSTEPKAEKPTPQKIEKPSQPTPTAKEEPSKETPTEPKKKGFFSRAKEGLQNWSKKEKQWFTDKVHKGNSPERRSFTDAVKHKLKGAVHAVMEGAKHEAHTFKEAGKGLYNFFALKEVTPEQKKALVSVAKKIAVAAATSVAIAATGGTAGLATLAHHGSAAFLKHVAIEFIPHLTVETLAVGTGRAALFAGEEEKDPEKLMEKFMNTIIDKLATEEIPTEILLKAIENYNAEKGASGEQGINKENLNIKELKREIREAFSLNNEIKKELKQYKLK
jgi:hypothetical protein